MLFDLSSTLLITYCLSYTAYIILPILQNKHHLTNQSNQVFYHPFMQTEIAAIGNMLCLIPFFINKKQNLHKQNKSDKKSAPKYIIFIVTLLDITLSILQYTAMNYLSGSVFSITSSIVIVSTAFFSKLLLKKSFNKMQKIGCILAVFGVIVTGFGQQIDSKSQQQQAQFMFGIMLTLGGFISNGLQIVIIEIIYAQYQIDPSQLVGTWGAMGFALWSGVLVILSFVGCPFSNSQCVQDFNGNYHLEYVPAFYQQISKDYLITIFIILNILTLTVLNYSANFIIMGGAMVYVLLQTFCNGLIWVVGIIITIMANGNSEYTIESLNIAVILTKIVGFVLSTMGLFCYNEVCIKNQRRQYVEIKI